MSAPSGQATIIIKKRAHGKHPHHGGAWKVAFADFMTAMMAFFLVMWLLGLSPNVKKSIASYFRDPGAFANAGKGILPGTDHGVTGGGMNEKSSPTTVQEAKQTLQKAAEHLKLMLAEKFGDLKDRIDIRVTDEGLLIELREAPNDGFFASGSAVAKPETTAVLTAIAGEVGQLPNKVAIEGHTDSAPYASAQGGYTNWELSADRANAARRILDSKGLAVGQVEAVRGYADTRLRLQDKPLDPGNRRISIVVRRLDTQPAPGMATGIAPPPAGIALSPAGIAPPTAAVAPPPAVPAATLATTAKP